MKTNRVSFSIHFLIPVCRESIEIAFLFSARSDTNLFARQVSINAQSLKLPDEPLQHESLKIPLLFLE
jgi:hypothetical protein